jgi:selenophosphate synthetase-related protein
MFAESSAVGVTIDVGALPLPPGVALERWLLTFPSFGFLLSVRAADAAAVSARFAARSIACATVGTVDDSHAVRVRHAGTEAVFWDLAAEAFTGARAHVRH